ncbi:hypothetical protein C8A03DRAFT_13066 [Achaetomium macrosporum]|uniref:Uncharacterized protein n=1 Tax=Achaetomium macrosporum TaxID=79813 RepID=A0AAN7CEJ9_9PEZI|nr:hypothetical protein C8A03DRAFT_13066 [Achaetomium macrosporum]
MSTVELAFDIPGKGRARIPSSEQNDSWTDTDSAIDIRSRSTSVSCSNRQQKRSEAAESLRVWKQKMSLAREASQRHKYTHTERREREFRWGNDFYIDESGRLGVAKELADGECREMVAASPAVYGLQSCRWHKSKTNTRRAPRQAKTAEDDGRPPPPLLKVTDPEGQEWFLSDLFYYADNDDDDEEEEDDELYE